MTLIAAADYDPATLALPLTSGLLAMTAFDTTNLRLTFTVPANGAVFVRLQSTISGATTYPRVLMGVLEGATVRARQTPIGAFANGVATDLMTQEAVAVVSGLTSGASLTWDAAYGVEAVVASTHFGIGGPDNASGANAAAQFSFEIYDALSLLASVFYDPASAATVSGAALKAMTAFDTTNLRVTFKCPASGTVYWRVRVPWIRGATVWGQVLIGVLDSATVRARIAPQRGLTLVPAASVVGVADGSGIVSGLTPGQTYTWDAAYAIQVVNAGTIFEYGGPNNTTGADAWGGAAFEVWAA